MQAGFVISHIVFRCDNPTYNLSSAIVRFNKPALFISRRSIVRGLDQTWSSL